MFKASVLTKITNYYPKFQIQYKNNSLLMKLLSWILFWITTFMTISTTKLGNTLYFPSKSFIAHKPVTSLIMLLHEVTHMYDEKRFKIFYLLSFLPLFSCSRLYFEKRAYISSLYCMQLLNKKYNYHIDLSAQSSFFLTQFSGPTFYVMRLFYDLDKEFATALVAIESGNRPFNDKVFDILDDILLEA